MRLRFSSEKVILFSYFTGIILAGALLLMLPGAWAGPAPLRFIDALFTSTSAVCVTGLITVDTALYSRLGQVVIALLIQLGGLGIIAFATIYVTLPRRRISLVSSGIIKDYYIDEVEYNPKVIIKHILFATFSIEAIGAALLFLRFRALPDAVFLSVFHSISAFCNAGFSTFSTNLEAYVGDPIVNIAIMLLIVSGGIGFMVMRDIGKRVNGSRRRLTAQTRVVLGVTASLIAIGAVLFFLFESGNAMRDLPLSSRILASFFQSVTPRTAGFDTIPQGLLSQSSVLLTMLLMFIGASPGSTGGGVKTTTFFVVLMAALRGVDEKSRLTVGRRAVPPKTIIKAVGVVGKGMLLVLVAASGLLLAERGAIAAGTMSLADILFETISAFGTVGLSLGITASLSTASKLVLILTMFAGRVGLFAMALPTSAKRIERYVDLPETDMMIG